MQNGNIVKGYQGIMDLDLSLIDPKFHKEVVIQHMKDIDEYKREQLERPVKLRYDTAIMHAHNIIELDRRAAEQLRKTQFNYKIKRINKEKTLLNVLKNLKKYTINSRMLLL